MQVSDRFYEISTSSLIEGYLKLGSTLEDIDGYCARSDFQYLDRRPISVEVAAESGNVCQDFIYEISTPLISERVKDFFDDFGIDYLFYKRITLTRSNVGMREPYWLALPPRIDCLDIPRSEIDEDTMNAEQIVINTSKIGRYDIFKLAGVANLEIIVTEKLAKALEEKDFKGLFIYPLD